MTKFGQSFSMVAGDSKVIVAPITDAAGAAQSLTGATIVWKLRTANVEGAILLTKQTGGAGITLTTTTATNDTVNVALDDSDTVTFGGTSHYQECEATDASGNVSTLWIGKIIFKKTGVP